MKIRYFDTVWRDVRASKGWTNKIILLTLIAYIPIFGWIARYAYMYGWGREAAWRIYKPLPAKIFGSGDDKFYTRGIYILLYYFLVSAALVIVLGLISLGASGLFGAESLGVIKEANNSAKTVIQILAGIVLLIGGTLISIYDDLSAGFSSKIPALVKRDFSGIARITGMYVLLSIAVAVIVSISIAISAVFLIISSEGAVFSVSTLSDLFSLISSPITAIILLVSLFAISFIAIAFATFVELLAVRAVGYWVGQFDVTHWGAVNDPLPIYYEFSNAQYQAPSQAQYAPNSASVQQGEYGVSQSVGQVNQQQQDIQQEQVSVAAVEDVSHSADTQSIEAASGQKVDESSESNE